MDDGERFLNYLPLCIFLKFEGETWIVDDELGPGVWPLQPATRTWILNENSGTKIRRTGFALVPDYASTAFMIQGATLPASIADCGDVNDFGGLSDMMTTYVILSRVKAAHGLLLMRAFSPNIFQMGELPGPSCLLKLLRSRFNKETNNKNTYNPQQAATEYKNRMLDHEVWRAERRQSGPDWPCCDCGLSFPLAGYGTERLESTQPAKSCISLGHWRCCSVCTDIRAKLRELPAGRENKTRECTACGHRRINLYFDSDSSRICLACNHQRSFKHFRCAMCDKVIVMKAMHQSEDCDGTMVCMSCAQDNRIYTCTVCKQAKTEADFSKRYYHRQHNRYHRRCKECEICIGCKKQISDFRRFQVDSRKCFTCSGEDENTTCVVCGSSQPRSCFDYNQSRKDRVDWPRCKKCCKCSKCGETFDARSFEKDSERCVTCVKRATSISCAACWKTKTADCFSEKKGGHFDRLLTSVNVCKDCEQKGYSNRDTKSYQCCGCGESKGHGGFTTTQIVHHANRNSTLLCKSCVIRGQQIRQKLKQRGCLLCTCRSYNSRQHNPSNEKCALYPSFAGQKKWPGMNKGVSRADYDFHERITKKRKT